MSEDNINIEVAYATSKAQWVLPCEVGRRATIERCIKQSGILGLCPELVLEDLAVGVFGVHRRLSDAVKAGERVEIYRPLLCDPKEARQIRHSRDDGKPE